MVRIIGKNGPRFLLLLQDCEGSFCREFITPEELIIKYFGKLISLPRQVEKGHFLSSVPSEM